MSTISNRQAICNTLMDCAAADPSIMVLCSDSRGSASMGPFAKAFPEQFAEVGIAEQNLVSMAAGMAACGCKAFAFSPASFLSARSYEQAKVDVAYSHTNVKLIGISAGISYGALGMTHHSTQDFAAMSALSGMRVYAPCDQYQTAFLIRALLNDNDPAYVRVSRAASKDVYAADTAFVLNQAPVLRSGKDVTIVACGELTAPALEAAQLLGAHGIDAGVIDMYCLKPFDAKTLLEQAAQSQYVVTMEEHVAHGGLGSLVCQCLSEYHPMPVKQLALPDDHIQAGEGKDVLAWYHMDGPGAARQIEDWIRTMEQPKQQAPEHQSDNQHPDAPDSSHPSHRQDPSL